MDIPYACGEEIPECWNWFRQNLKEIEGFEELVLCTVYLRHPPLLAVLDFIRYPDRRSKYHYIYLAKGGKHRVLKKKKSKFWGHVVEYTMYSFLISFRNLASKCISFHSSVSCLPNQTYNACVQNARCTCDPCSILRVEWFVMNVSFTWNHSVKIG